ncbi:MAG: choice-of-anchor V domain-containing protein, partial [Thermoplasmata archaeon]
MIKMRRNVKKICGLGFCVIVVLLFVFVGVNGSTNGRWDRAQIGCGAAPNSCHKVADPLITVGISGLPPEYTPLQTYMLTISSVGGPGGDLGGFNLQVDFGTLSTTDPNAETNGPTNDQARHQNADARAWTVNWTAPAGGSGIVTFYLAAMSADGFSGNDGDSWKLYTTTVDELVTANNPPETQDLTVEGFADGTPGILHIINPTPTLGWTFTDPDGGDSQSEYQVRVGTGSTMNDMWAPTPVSGGASSVVYAGSALVDNIDYWFGVRVNDSTEWSLWNETQFHMNSLEAQDLTVQSFADATVGIMHITDHFPYLNWTFWDGEADSQTQYEVRVGTAPGLSNMWSLTLQPGATTSEIYAGTPLMDGADYWFGVRVYDGYEWSMWNETMFHMNSVEPQDLTVQGFTDGTNGILHITDHTPDLGWIFFDNEVDSQTQYEIRVGTGSGLSDMWIFGPQPGAATSEIYAGLPLFDFTDYWFGIRVFDGYEWSPWNETQFHLNNLSEARDLTVDGFSDGTPGIMHITVANPDLGWTFFDFEGGDVQQQYEVRVGTSSGASDLWFLPAQIGPINSVTYAGLPLVEGTDYWFSVRVYDGFEWSLWNETQFHMNSFSKAEALTVQGYNTGTPGIMHITDHTPDLGWTFFDPEIGDTQQQYEIRVGTGSGLSDMWVPGPQAGATNTETYAGLTLLDGMDYWFGIRVYDGYEWSPWNETQFHMNSVEVQGLTVEGFADGTNGILHITDHTPDLGWTFIDGEADTQQENEIRVGTGPGLSDMWVFGPQVGAATSEVYAGLPLIDFTDYWFGIRVFDGYEWSLWNETQFHLNNLSEAQDLTVDGFTNASPGILHITNSNPQLGWTFFDFEGGDIQQEYEVRVGSSPGASDMWSLPPQIGPTNSVTYAGLPLMEGTDYWFSVRVYDGFEWSPWNETQFHLNALSEAQDLAVQGYSTGTQGIMHITDHTPDLEWSFFDPEIGDSQQEYEIRVGTGSGLSDMWTFGPSAGATTLEIYAGLTLLDGTDYWFGIRVYDGYEWSLWNETQFHMNSLPPAPIPPLSPPDDSNVPSSPAQTLSWSAGGAESEGDTITYWWFVDTDNPPMLPYIANGTTTGLSSISFSTSPATDYYWYVNATDGWEWNTTIVWNFTTSVIVNNPPEAIDLAVSGFSDGTNGIMHITDHTPQLEWLFSDPDGGDTQQQYEIRVGTSSGFSDMWSPGIQAGGINSVVYAGLILQDGVDYFFAIRVNDGNTWSAWNETQFHMNSVEAWTLTVSGYTTGTQGILHIIDHTPDLGWSYWDLEIGDSQQQYEIRVGTSSSLSDMWSFGPAGGPSSSEIYTGLTLLDGTDYWFGIRVFDNYEWSEWNETLFHMNALPPAPAPPLSPPDDANIPSSPAQILSWSVGGADSEGDTITYWWYVDTDDPPIPPYLANGSTTGTSSSSFATSPATDYYWYVNVTDGWEWNASIIWNFTTSAVVNNPPEALDLLVSGFSEGTSEIMHVLDHTPNLAWSFFDPDVGDTQQQYEVRVGTGSGLSDMWAPGPQVGAGNTETYSGLPLVDGVDYWFGIRVFDGNTWSLWNETLFHMNALPPTPVPPLNPPDDANIPDSPAQTLSWTAGGVDSEGDTITYWWYVDTNNPPAFPYNANGTTTGTSSTSFSTAPGTNYYWIINVTDGWEWTSILVWNFTTTGSVNIPPEARDLSVSGFGEATAGILHIIDSTPDLGWSFFDSDLGDFQQQYEVRVGTASGLSDMWAPGPQAGGGNSVVYAGSPLVDGTDYWFGVLVYDGLDWSLLNETMFHMNTQPVARSLTVAGFSEGSQEIMHIVNHTPDLAWSFSDSEAGDTQIQYEIRVGTSSGLSDMWAPGIQVGSLNSVLYGGSALLNNADYWFGIRIYDGYEWSAWNETQFHLNSLQAQGLTVQSFTDGSPGILRITDHTPYLNWTFWDGEGDTQMQYEVRVGSAPGLSDMWSNGPLPGTTTSEIYPGSPLRDGDDYWFGIRVYDGYEWSSWNETRFHMNSVEVQNLTVQGFADATQGILHITDHTPDLSWSFFDIDSGDFQQQYEIRVGAASGLSDMWAFGPQVGAGNSMVYAGSSLMDGIDYWFGILVYDGIEWSLLNETMFHMNTPPQAQDLTVSGFTDSTTDIMHIIDHTPDLGWSPLDLEVGDTQVEYEVRVGTAADLSDMWAPGPQTGALNSVIYGGSALLDGTDYWFGMRVYDGYEWSLWNESMFHMNTPPPAPVPPLNPPDDTNISSNATQTLNWTSGGADFEGDIVTYYWYVDTDDPTSAPYVANNFTIVTSSTP